MTRFALLALAALLPLSAQAQKATPKGGAPPAAASALPDTLRPGDLDVVAPTAGEVTYTVRLLAPMQQDIGTLTETVTVDGDAITRTSNVNVPMAGQDETTVSTLDGATLATRAVTMDGSTAVGELTITDDRATGTRGVISAPGETLSPEPVDEALSGPHFGGGWIDALVRSVPLTEGHTHHVVVYSARDGAGLVRMTVLGERTEKPAGGAATTFVAVETDDGEQTMTHFVDAETRMIQMVRFSPQPGVEVEFVRD